MNKQELIKLLHQSGCCQPYMMQTKSLKPEDLTTDKLLKMYIDGIDFTLENPVFSADFLQANATEKELEAANIFVKSAARIFNSGEVIILINSYVEILQSGFNVSRIYALNSKVSLDCTENSITMLDLHGSSSAYVHNHNAKVTVNLYPGSTVEADKGVSVNYK